MAAGMFCGLFMSTFFERVRAALASKGYGVLRELGSGGMGVVVLARHVKLDRLVAVKVIRPEMHTAVATERFGVESKTLAALSHPNIVPVYDADEADGLPYYAMKYLDGETVADRVRKGPLGSDEVRKLGRDLLDALELVHTRRAVHRDVKPANIFWDGKSAVLVDFGIAKRVPLPGQPAEQTGDPLTEPGARPGTRSYMSPEQLAGAEASPASDLYAAALVIYEAYTAWHWLEAQRRGWRVWSGIPGPEARVLRRALAWKPERRWPDAAVFRRRLWRTGVWPFQLRTILLTIAGLVAGAGVTVAIGHQKQEGKWPFHPSASVELYVTPFDTIATRGSAVVAGLAGALVRKLIGYPDFSVYGPGSLPWLRRNAALVLRGTVHGVGDSLSVELQIRAGTRGGQPSVISVRGDTRHPDLLVDSLAFGVVRAIWNRENSLDPSLPLGALPQTSAGLAAWLAAERLFADARWGQADAAYAVAEAIDSTCRLCYWRHRQVQQWLGRDPDPALMAHYLPYLHSFPPRYESLMRAVSLPLRARLDTLRRITEQWDDFFPAWFQRADDLYHRGPLVGYARADAVEAFQKTVRLRPAFGPSLEHLTWALTAEGDSSGAWAAWRRLEALGNPSDAFTVAIRSLLRVGYAFRFQDSTAARRVLDSVLVAEGIQRFPQLAAGPRYLPSFDASVGAVAMGELFEASGDRVLQRSGLVAATFGLVSLGQLASARAELGRLRDRFDAPELGLTERELDGALLILGFETAASPSEWSRVAEALARDADPRSTLSEVARRRAAWLLSLASRRLGGADTAQYRALLLGEPLPRPLGRLLAADALAHRGRYSEALQASDTLTELEAPTLSGTVPVDPFFRTVLHMLRAEWSAATGQSRDAARELLWFQNNDVSGYPTRDPQVADVDWAFGTFARWRRAALLEKGGRHDEACHAYRDVARLWSRGDPPYRARADSAARRLVTLECKAAA
jgi:hypothetical protein